MNGPLRADQLASFESDGFVIVHGWFQPEEVALMRQAARTDPDSDSVM